MEGLLSDVASLKEEKRNKMAMAERVRAKTGTLYQLLIRQVQADVEDYKTATNDTSIDCRFVAGVGLRVIRDTVFPRFLLTLTPEDGAIGVETRFQRNTFENCNVVTSSIEIVAGTGPAEFFYIVNGKRRAEVAEVSGDLLDVPLRSIHQ